MNNYQLYRTNLFLGGQMKWDLIVDSSQNTLYVSDFHLTPISNNTPYTYKSEELLVKNTHQDNVKTYYHSNKGYFYDECLDAVFSHNWPIINDSNDNLTIYSNIYDMGCKRSKRYNEYKKQFEFFCPLWLEHLYDDVKFKININDVTTNKRLASNVLVLKTNTIANAHHNKFIQYFNNYINDAGLNNGSDDVLNIQFKNNSSTITGLNVEHGLFETHHITDLVDNITSRERTLMETDNMLIQSFVNNAMICKQLFNFNLCFNIEDIISGSITNMMYGENISVSIDVYIGDTKLETRDFYTEYDYINKCIISAKPINFSENVLSYLRDNEYIELIDKNKFVQSICHWSLCDNNDYIFNVYDGFSGLCVEQNSDKTYMIYENQHQYCNAPNTVITKADKNQNSTGWITSYEVLSWNDFYKFVKNSNKYKLSGTLIGKSNFINNIKYNFIPKNNDLYIVGLSMSAKLLTSIRESFNCYELVYNSVYIIRQNDLIIVLTSNVDNLSFGCFYNILNSFDETTITDTIIADYLTNLRKMMGSKVEASIVVFNNSLLYNTVNGPSVECTEIEYFKEDNIFNYVVRYDGKIKPTFSTKPSTLYYKDYISGIDESKLKNSVYAKYDSNKFDPLYPSINYCAIKKMNNWDYNTLPLVYVSNIDVPVNVYDNVYEYSWFNNNRCLILKPEIYLSYINTKPYKETDEIVTEYISSYYNINDINLLNYIKSLYTYTNNWDYCSDTNINDYVYNISIKLK